MGFLDTQGSTGLPSSSHLNLVDFEKNLIHKFNLPELLNTKYRAEEFGIAFDKRSKASDVYTYETGEVVVICPEPLEFIKEFDDVSSNTNAANELFLKKLASFQRMTLDKKPLLKAGEAYGERMWMNKTLTGINLRPGNLNDDREDFSPIRMCDDNVHGLIAGRTGSGKSVYINALILSLITEYPPWELNLYLADFKKVELSRYMNDADEKNEHTAFTPHVNACAATSEIRYVISLIQYLVDCMNARQEFFSRLGVTKIQEFRNKYHLVLPRVLLIVDEFQQLFTEATNREREELQFMLNSITKLGRATGFHLIFASQEMSGTLRGNTLANFKIRMTLPCSQQISVDILGNSQAASLERGYVIINTEAGNELDNKKYRVPFIETDKRDADDGSEKPPFYRYLDEIKTAGLPFDLRYKAATQKFYREELQESERDYRQELDQIRTRKNHLVAQNSGLFDAVVLGKTVLYSPRRNDKVSFYIERGRNKGIMIASPDAETAARIRKLLAENLFRSDIKTYHLGMEVNNLVLERYRIDKAVENYPLQTYVNCDVDRAPTYLRLIYLLRRAALRTLQQNEHEYARVRELEEELSRHLADGEQYVECQRIRGEREALLARIALLSQQGKTGPSPAKALPILQYLELCSSRIPLLPDGTKADLASLKLYQEVVKGLSTSQDLESSVKRYAAVLDQKVAELSARSGDPSMDLAILQNKILKRALLYYADRCQGRAPQKTSLSDALEGCYLRVQSLAEAHHAECLSRQSAAEELERARAALEELEQHPNHLMETEDELRGLLSDFVQTIFHEAYTTIGLRKNQFQIPEVELQLVDVEPLWVLRGEGLERELEIIGNDILRAFLKVCQDGVCGGGIFAKVVFWLNGMDEVEKLPAQMVEVIRNAVNLNILAVAIITSELKDSTIRKAFDYAFITGNIEKFYSMFDIKYTRQPLDSIVVNFGIRSKGLDIPFKMYKSSLAEVQTPDFIDHLLNDSGELFG